MVDVDDDDLELELPNRPISRSEAVDLARLFHDLKTRRRLTKEFQEATERDRSDLDRRRDQEKERGQELAEWYAAIEVDFYATLGEVDHALDDINEVLSARRRQLDEADQRQQADADRHPDGQAVFWSENGEQAIYADGSPVPSAALASATRRPGATSAEQREAWLRERAQQDRLEREALAAQEESRRLREQGITPENAREQHEAAQRLRERVEQLRQSIDAGRDMTLSDRTATRTAISDLERRFSSANSYAASQQPMPTASAALPALRDGFAQAANPIQGSPDASAPNLVSPIDPRKALGLSQ